MSLKADDALHGDGRIYQNIHLSGHAHAIFGDYTAKESAVPKRAEFTGAYAHSSLHPVAGYVSRPGLEWQLYEQLPVSLQAEDDNYQGRTVVVFGLGGAGKSQLVLNFVRERQRQYRAVFWIEADQKETIERDYLQVYKLLFPDAIANNAIVPIDSVVAAVKNWFHGRGRCLWVMDSADEIADEESATYVDLDHYLPDAPQLDRIITTRSAQAQSLSSHKAVAVVEMNEDEAIQLFYTYAKLKQTENEKTRTEVLAIVQELGCFALAVMLAGSYVGETPRLFSNIKLFLPQYHEHRQRLFSRRARRSIHRYGESVLSTWELSFTVLERQTPEAAQLLTLLAFLNFDDIFMYLFTPKICPIAACDCHDNKIPRWVQLVSPESTNIDEYAVEEWLVQLQAYSLVSWQETQQAYAMHKLVHAWSYERLEVAQRQGWCLAVLELLALVMHVNENNSQLNTRLVPHVMATFTAVAAVCESTYNYAPQDLDSLTTISEQLCQLGRWTYAHDVLTLLSAAQELIYGLEHPSTLTTLHHVGAALCEQGKYEQAEAMDRKVLELHKKIRRPNDRETMNTMHNLAITLLGQAKYEQAELMIRETLELKTEVLGPEHPDMIMSLNGLGLIVARLGNHAQAEALFGQALDLSKKVCGATHFVTLQCMNYLAIALREQHKAGAESLLRETLNLREQILGREHPHTLTSLTNLAELLRQKGKYEVAEAMNNRAIKSYKKLLGPEHPATLATKNNLALVFYSRGKYEQAELIFTEVTESMNMVLGTSHPETLLYMSNLAVTLRHQNKHDEAEAIQSEVVELQKKIFGLEHPHTLTSMNNLATTLSYQGKQNQAKALCLRTLELKKKALGNEHPETVSCMSDLASILVDLGENDQAIALFLHVVELTKKVQGDEHPQTLTAITNLASTLGRQGKTGEAEGLLLPALELSTKVLGIDHPITSRGMLCLSRIQGIQDGVERLT